MKHSKDCVICETHFKTNNASKITCNEICKAERKRLQKIEAYHAESEAEKLIKKRNEFLLSKVGVSHETRI